LSRSIDNIGDLTKLFFTQYSSRQEFKQNNHHILSVKIRPIDDLNAYISYFQNQLATQLQRRRICSQFISGLWVTRLLYKHLVKYNITRWSEALYRA